MEQISSLQGDQSPNTLWSLTAGERHRYAAAVLAMAVTNLCMFGAPVLGGQALDAISADDLSSLHPWLLNVVNTVGLGGSLREFLWFAAGATVALTALGGLFMYLRGRLAARASERIARRTRQRLYNRLHHVSASFHDKNDTGDLVQRCSSDIETLRVFLVTDVIEIGRAVMLVLCLVPVLFAIHVELAWLSLFMMPFITLGAYLFFKRVKSVFQATDEAEGVLTAGLQENLTGIRVVKAFARQAHETERFAVNNAEFRDRNHQLMRLMGYYWSISDFFAMTQMGIVLLAGGYFAMQQSITVGDLFIFITCESIVIWPVRHLGRVLTDSGKAVVALERIDHILTQAEEPKGFTPLHGRAKGNIQATGLSLRYDEANILDQINVDIRAGDTVGIVGAPGSGKSTLIRALLGLYPYHSGSLTLDGEEISELNRHWLRNQIGVVLQDPFLYSRSIADNIRVGRSRANDTHLQQAAGEAALLSSIETFNNGFEEIIGERGVTLSGGQRQRLALARALVKDAPVLVLDDALSAVDSNTEAHILAALAQRKGKHTTLIVAHRLSTIHHTDYILVMDKGAVVQAGPHDELAHEVGPYRNLYRIQSELDEQIRSDLQSAGEHNHV